MRSAIVVLLASMLGCSAPDSAAIVKCDPEAPFPTEQCRDQLDAGSDADANTAIDPPDPSAQAATCSGRCVPEPSDISGGSWPRTQEWDLIDRRLVHEPADAWQRDWQQGDHRPGLHAGHVFRERR